MIHVVAYPNVVAAVAWLEAAFGFRVRLRIGSHRTQMWFGSPCLIVGETGEGDQWATKSSVMLRVSDVEDLHSLPTPNRRVNVLYRLGQRPDVPSEVSQCGLVLTVHMLLRCKNDLRSLLLRPCAHLVKASATL